MSASETATQFIGAVREILAGELASDYEKAQQIAQLSNETFPANVEPLKQTTTEGNHCVNLSPERIYRLNDYVDDDVKVTRAALVSVMFTNGQHWVPKEDTDILFTDSFLRKFQGEVELPGIHGIIKVNGSQRGNAAVNLRYEKHDPNLRADVHQWQIRIFYVKESTINLSQL